MSPFEFSDGLFYFLYVIFNFYNMDKFAFFSLMLLFLYFLIVSTNEKEFIASSLGLASSLLCLIGIMCEDYKERKNGSK